MANSAKKTVTDDARQRLRNFNPFVVGLEDRKGARHDNFQLFDGQSTLETFPMEEFDGYPLRREYLFFVPIVVLAIYTVLLPFLPIFLKVSAIQCGAAVLSGFVVALFFSVLTAFHLTRIRTAYQTANSDVQNLNFVTKARGIRSIIHNFKNIVRWRRFMRYTMNFGYLSLTLLTAVEELGLFQSGPNITIHKDTGSLLLSGVLLLVSGASFLIFEYGRKKYTEGMDPTLALVLMIEEIGGQLANRPTIVTNSRKE